MREIDFPKSLIELQKNAAVEIFAVGGYIRNFFADLGATDLDLAGSVLPSELGLPNTYLVVEVNQRLKTAIIKTPCGDKYEYTPFRIESYGAGGEHTPNLVKFTSELKIDALRRDFACNSIYYSLKKGEFVDPLLGKDDAKNKILRADNPKRILQDDGLRLMRLIRIASETGFTIEKNTAEVAKENAYLLKDISKERIREELERILVADKKYGVENAHIRGVELLIAQGLWELIFSANPSPLTPLPLSLAPINIRLPVLLFNYQGNLSHLLKNLKYPNKTLHEVVSLISATKEFLHTESFRLLAVRNFHYLEKIANIILAIYNDKNLANKILLEKQTIEQKKIPLSIADLKITGSDLIKQGITGKKIGETLERLFLLCVESPELNDYERLNRCTLKQKN